MTPSNHNFPFSAIVGQERLKEALMLNAINPAIGGVLIFGEKGTAKSTAVRGLKSVLEEKDQSQTIPLVELPLSATEEMVVGTLNIPDTLKKEKLTIEYGLLYKAHQGILYIDEVNLLEDHLVNSIIDSAAMGVNRIEREGVSHEHPSRFILIGTMNPEEGELRPQLLDRFGISVSVTTEMDPAVRKEIISRRLSWEQDKETFNTKWMEQEQESREVIQRARKLLPSVTLKPELLDLLIAIVIDAKVEGHRADLVIQKTGMTLAAFHNRNEVNEEDILRAAEYALNHRGGFTPPQPPAPDEPQEDSRDDSKQNESQDNAQSNPDSSSQFQQTDQSPAQQQFETLELISKEARAGQRGKSESRIETNNRGPVRGYFQNSRARKKGLSVALFPTLLKTLKRGRKKLSQIDVQDLCFKKRVSGQKELHLLVLDTSASMGTQKRLSYAKGMIQRILRSDYQKKHFVTLIGTTGTGSRVWIPPSRNLWQIEKALEKVCAQGKTCLLHALDSAVKTANGFHKKNQYLLNLMVIVSDGRINVPLKSSIKEDIFTLGERIRKLKIENFIVDSNKAYGGSVLLKWMSEQFGGHYMMMNEVNKRDKVIL